jgi:hypothetical protein
MELPPASPDCRGFLEIVAGCNAVAQAPPGSLVVVTLR